MVSTVVKAQRVIVVFWKKRPESPFEVFSSLKNLCLSHTQFNYHTLSNYLSKAKMPYDNNEVRIERKNIISKPETSTLNERKREIAPVVRKVMMKDADDEQYELDYWQTKSIKERAEAITFIISQSLSEGQRMDKSKLVKKSLS